MNGNLTISMVDDMIAEEEAKIKECIAEGKVYYNPTDLGSSTEAGRYFRQKMQELEEKYADYFKIWRSEQKKEMLDLKIKTLRDKISILESEIENLTTTSQNLAIQVDEDKNKLATQNEQGKSK